MCHLSTITNNFTFTITVTLPVASNEVTPTLLSEARAAAQEAAQEAAQSITQEFLSDVAPERNSWRDEAYSKRHRSYGWDCPMNDIDWVVSSAGEDVEGVGVEFDQGRAVALIEAKRAPLATINAKSCQSNTLRSLAGDRHPLLGVEYWHGSDEISDEAGEREEYCWYYRVRGLNQVAKHWLKEHGYGEIQKMSEQAYVEMLCRLRGRTMPACIRARLCPHKPSSGYFQSVKMSEK